MNEQMLKTRVAALKAGLQHVLHVLNDKQDNGRPQPATVRASMARIAAEKALAGDTMALDEMLAEARREASVPDGFVVMPKEPTPEMLAAADAMALLELTDDVEERSEERRRTEFATAYRAMVTAGIDNCEPEDKA